MAHFYGGVRGNKGEVTRLGSKGSGLSCFANGWGLGIQAHLHYDEDKDEDIVSVSLTSGSGGNSGRDRWIGSFTTKDLL